MTAFLAFSIGFYVAVFVGLIWSMVPIPAAAYPRSGGKGAGRNSLRTSAQPLHQRAHKLADADGSYGVAFLDHGSFN